MKKYSLLVILALTFVSVFAQAPERKEMRQGNKLYKKEAYDKAEVAYRHGLEKDTTSFGARFNLADALYKQGNAEQAEKLFSSLTTVEAAGAAKKAKLYHNLGNAQLQQKKYDQSVNAYKQSLRIDPSDDETRANLAYAQMMLEQQQQDQQNNPDNQNQDKDNRNNQDNKDNKDNQDNKDDQQDQNKDQQNQDQQNQDKNESQQDQQEQPQKISPQDAQRMLEAVQADEKETQEKVNREKAKALKRQKIEKNW